VSALLLTLSLWIPGAFAARVALLENYHRGQLMRLEPGGQFAHVAIAVRDRYLHAHAAVGVEMTDSLDAFGVNIHVFENPAVPEPTDEQVRRYLRLRYHPRLEWNDNDGTTYSARLVGELLGIAPRPALFQAEIWAGYDAGSTVGLSPDDIHQIITREMGFRLRSCDGQLTH
jgi:hypothetical protein